MEDAFKKAAEEQMRADLNKNIFVKEQTSFPANPTNPKDKSILLGGLLVGGIVLMLAGVGGVALFQNKNAKEAVVKTFDTSTGEIETSVVPTVPLREEYENPFEDSTAYVNPFSRDYNPFVLIDEGY